MEATPKKMGRPAKPNPVLQALEGISARIEDISTRVATLEATPVEKSVHNSVQPRENVGQPATPANNMGKVNWTSGINGQPTTAPAGGTATVKTVVPAALVPADYVNEKNRILGEDFGFIMETMSDEPFFEITIIVPEEKSNMGPDQRTMAKVDERSRKIPLGEGINGVRSLYEDIRKQLQMNAPAQKPLSLN